MADSSQPMLPAFGIRALNGSEAPPGVVQITAHQYDDTVQSVPDAMLSYMDEDDGEFITVGSSFELGQRLDEPAQHSTLSIPAALKLTPTPEADDKMMHIFDIQHNSKSMAAWKTHHTSTIKKMNSRGTSAGRETVNHPRSASPQPHSAFSASAGDSSLCPRLANPNESPQAPDMNKASLPTAMSEHVASGVTPTQPISGQPAKEDSTELENALSDVFHGLGSHMGPIADFLEITAFGLRKAAEKSTRAERSPVEGVLSGFKGIMSDVGELGLGFLAAIDHELKEHKANNANRPGLPVSEPTEPPSPSVLSPATGEHQAQPKAETNAKRVSFVQSTLSQPEPILGPVRAPVDPVRPSIDPNRSFYLPSAQKPKFSGVPRHEDLKPPAAHAVETVSARAETDKSSILDLEPSEPDFCARYPPLISVRKAKSVSGLQDKYKISSSFGPTGISTASALTRYPSIGQFEQQTRLKTRAKFDEKPSIKDKTLASVSSPNSATEPKKIDVYKKPSVEDDVELEQPGTLNKEVKTVIKVISTALPATTVPGAWPEQKSEEVHPAVAAPKPSYLDWSMQATENSAPPTQGQKPGALSPRLNGPVTDMYPRATAAYLPRRYHTVGGTNPAARLNGPFDPLAPLASQPIDGPAGGGPNAKLPLWMTPLNEYRPIYSTAFDRPKPTAGDHQPKGALRQSISRPASGNADWSFSGQGSREEVLSRAQSTNTSYRHVFAQPPQFTRMRARHADLLRPSFDNLTNKPRVNRPSTDVMAFGPAPPVPMHAHPSQSVSSVNPQTHNHHFGRNSGQPSSSSISSTVVRSRPNLSPITSPTPYTRPRGRTGVVAPPPSSTTVVGRCVKTLRVMGYGTMDHNEMSRLNIYASAAAGDVEAAIEMIEEDREAAKALADRQASAEMLDSEAQKFFGEV
ncbi:hypothetical protein A1O3_03098 [Capronia epimyces CBS 606.96]|uniref:Uncharacterized protein n=1 Tax=Capronia epimyces CBS 606.96 TaxID=1182542 RepID=W9YK23_9EURO|nr:uncharacterized protein A1O3_03098 [Capronia epimyces CBS 606.96]EXJ90030.1 hypothetical protein A1O3_03098 [Capronia epimyces CBS 606.96]